MITTIFFDLGGVVITLSPEEAERRFAALGLEDAHRQLDPYTQQGYFGDLEEGKISDEDFRMQLSAAIGREVSWGECRHAWLGYRKEVPQRNLDCLRRLRGEGYRLVLTSNTNPFMMSWAESGDFDGHGNALGSYFDAEYKSFEIGHMKPSEEFFRHILRNERVVPGEVLFVDDGARNVAAASEMGVNTMLVGNGDDWTGSIFDRLADCR